MIEHYQAVDPPTACEVHVDGRWWPGFVEHWRRRDGRWEGDVRWTRAPGETYLGWYDQEQLRPRAQGLHDGLH